MNKRILVAALAAASPLTTSAVYLDNDGLGQALIYPYYSAQSASGNSLNTYLSVVNHTADAKVVRVRFREARNAAEVTSFNLFLSPNDVWTGAVIPGTGGGARLITRDNSCADPGFASDFAPGSVPFVDFRNTLYAGANSDGAGDGLDRTREGYIEILEMATVTGASATAVTHNSAGIPANCAAVRSPAVPATAAPTGGLSGTLTLINVANGMDFNLNATALAELATRAYFRAPADASADFNAAEIDPVSAVVANGSAYRSTWSRPVDAVSATLMRSTWMGEFVLDAVTHSKTDLVMTYPTRRHYVTNFVSTAPFGVTPVCMNTFNTSLQLTLAGEPAEIRYFDREELAILYRGDALSDQPPPPPEFRCSALTTLSISNGSAFFARVLGSANVALWPGVLFVPVVTTSGWISITPTSGRTLQSLPTSTRTDLATGITTTGAHAYTGLPVVGFAVRTFENGTLTCTGAASCQGNYGAAFPLRYRRAISPGSGS